jgi:hypothetical protein
VDGHTVADIDSELGQCHADAGGAVGVFVPRVGNPDTEFVVAQCGFLAHVPGSRRQHGRQ